jgi:hypothetical protein
MLTLFKISEKIKLIFNFNKKNYFPFFSGMYQRRLILSEFYLKGLSVRKKLLICER